MGFFRVFIWALIFYIIFKLIKGLFRIFTAPKEDPRKRKTTTKDEKKSKIRQEDIIEAEFEEIKEKENDKEKSKD